MGERKITARLALPLPWIHERQTTIETVEVARGGDLSLTYLEDGIVLAIEILNPADDRGELVDRATNPPPGTLALVAGDIPLDVRAELRRAKVSFLDVDGTAELFWPRLRISASRVTDEGLQRRTPPVTLRGGHGRVVQALLAPWLDGDLIESGADLAVNGHWDLPVGGREISPVADSRTPQPRT